MVMYVAQQLNIYKSKLWHFLKQIYVYFGKKVLGNCCELLVFQGA